MKWSAKKLYVQAVYTAIVLSSLIAAAVASV